MAITHTSSLSSEQNNKAISALIVVRIIFTGTPYMLCGN